MVRAAGMFGTGACLQSGAGMFTLGASVSRRQKLCDCFGQVLAVLCTF